MSGPKCVDRRSVKLSCFQQASESIIRNLNATRVTTTHKAITVAKTNLDSVVGRSKTIRNQDVMERTDTTGLEARLSDDRGDLKADISQWRMAELPLERGETIGKSKSEGQQLTVLQQFEIDPLETGENGCLLLVEAEDDLGVKTLHIVIDDKYINEDGSFKDERLEQKYNAVFDDLELALGALEQDLHHDSDLAGTHESLEVLGLMADLEEAHDEAGVISEPKVTQNDVAEKAGAGKKKVLSVKE